MAKFPALPLWIDAWASDTNHLTHCEKGLYLDLLILMWRTPECRVPNDPDWLAKRLRSKPEDFVPLIREFCQTDGNWVTQKRLLKEYNFVKSGNNKRSVSAKLRWANNKKSKALGKEGGNSRVIENEGVGSVPSKSLSDNKIDSYNAYAPTPTPTPTLISKKESKKDSCTPDFETFWGAYPRHIGKPAAAKAFTRAIGKASLEEILAALNWQAMGWNDPQFIPYPATWLNQERWTDEKTERTNGHGRNGRHESVIDRTKRLYERAVELETAKATGRTAPAFGGDSFGREPDGELSGRR